MLICRNVPVLAAGAVGRINQHMWERLGGIIGNGAFGRFLHYSMDSLRFILKVPFGIY